MTARNFWSCPYCQRKFTTRNQSHACIFYTVEQHLKLANPQVVDLYERFAEMVRKCGDAIIEATKTSIVFKTPAMFAVVHLKKSSMGVAFWLPRPLDHPRIRRIYSDSPYSYAHHIRVNSFEDLDEHLQNWLCEAYMAAI